MDSASNENLIVYHTARGANPRGVGIRDPQILGKGSWRSQGVVDGAWNIIISYHVQEVCSKVIIFEEK